MLTYVSEKFLQTLVLWLGLLAKGKKSYKTYLNPMSPPFTVSTKLYPMIVHGEGNSLFVHGLPNFSLYVQDMCFERFYELQGSVFF